MRRHVGGGPLRSSVFTSLEIHCLVGAKNPMKISGVGMGFSADIVRCSKLHMKLVAVCCSHCMHQSSP